MKHAFEDGKDYYVEDIQRGAGVASDALKAGRIVVLGTGSPGLDYTVVLHDGAMDESTSSAARARARFPLVVSDGCLLVRDGYVTSWWGDRAYAVERIAVSDGFYEVDVAWLPSGSGGHILLHLFLRPVEDAPVDCTGWIDLVDDGDEEEAARPK